MDQTGTAANTARTYGLGPRRERLVYATPHGHWCTTFVAGLGASGVVPLLVLDSSTTGEVFVAYAE